jgi:hypothetical protein
VTALTSGTRIRFPKLMLSLRLTWASRSGQGRPPVRSGSLSYQQKLHLRGGYAPGENPLWNNCEFRFAALRRYCRDRQKVRPRLGALPEDKPEFWSAPSFSQGLWLNLHTYSNSWRLSGSKPPSRFCIRLSRICASVLTTKWRCLGDRYGNLERV